MVKQTINFFQSQQQIADWEFAKEKKQRIKSKSGKTVNSEYYITFKQSTSAFAYIFFSLAAEEAFGFNKVQQITQKLKGQNEEWAQMYQNCKKALNLNWDGSTSLPNLIKGKREALEDQQQNLIQISKKIDEEQARQLLKSGLSQRKIHLDLHSSNGEQSETIIPELQNINDSVTIIVNPQKNLWLLAFFSHVQKPSQIIQNEPQESSIKVEEIPKQASKVINAPVHPNPDDMPLKPPVQQKNHSKKNIVDPDDRQLRPPADLVQDREASKSVPTAPRHIQHPDEKFLIPPSKDEDLVVVGKGYDLKQNKTEAKIHEVKNRNWVDNVLFAGVVSLIAVAFTTKQ